MNYGAFPHGCENVLYSTTSSLILPSVYNYYLIQSLTTFHNFVIFNPLSLSSDSYFLSYINTAI